MIVHITRFAFVTAGAMGGFAVSRLLDWPDTIGLPQYYVILILILLGSSIGYIIGGIFGREFADIYATVEQKLVDMAPVDFALGMAGIIGGMLVALIVSWPLRQLQPAWMTVVSTTVLFVIGGYAGFRIALIKRDDIARSFSRFSEDHGDESQPEAGMPIKLLDTSAIIDGRFIDLVQLGVLDGDLRTPRFVLAELQTLADSVDDVKRARGRRGLDLLTRVSSGEIGVRLFEADYPTIPETDSKLMSLAEDLKAAIVTVDYNLTKVARVRDLTVVNLNEVATALKPAYLPGETLRLEVQREGKEEGQGVGYLDDGTMVVVQEAAEHVGSRVDAEVTSVLQTSSGRMIFARQKAVSGPGDDIA